MEVKLHGQLFYVFLGLTISVVFFKIDFTTQVIHAVQCAILEATYRAQIVLHRELNQKNQFWTFSKSHLRFLSPKRLIPFITARSIILNVRSSLK